MNDSKPRKINMSSPDLSAEDRSAVMDVVNTNWLSMGPKIKAFEEAFRSLIGLPYALGVNSGTAGLHLAAVAAGIRDGDLVITTPFSFVASTNALLYERAVPVYVDVDPLTGNIDPVGVRQAVEDLLAGGSAAQRWLPWRGAEQHGALKALLPVDVFGQPADMDPIVDVARQHGLTVIEDSCEALGATYKGRQAGTLGDVGVFAFYPNKQITTGEGGLIVTGDERLGTMMDALRNQGRAPGDQWLNHTYLGFNYRMDEMSAALGHSQLKRLDSFLEARQRVAGWYNDRLKDVSGVEIPQIVDTTTRMSWFVYVIRLAAEIDRAKVAKRLDEQGIAVRPYFLPIHLQPYMVERFGYREGDFPVTEDLGRRGLALPFSSVMHEEEVDFVCRVLRSVL